jgi:hypothetical protein
MAITFTPKMLEPGREHYVLQDMRDLVGRGRTADAADYGRTYLKGKNPDDYPKVRDYLKQIS